MGRNSVDATKASLIRCALAALSLLAAALNVFLRPRGAVTDLLAAELVFFCGFAPAFEAVEPVLVAEAVVAFLFGVCVVADAAELEAFGVVSSYLFPSAGVTTINAQSSVAGASAALVADLREKVDLIVSL
jgi:hypothetical protein